MSYYRLGIRQIKTINRTLIDSEYADGNMTNYFKEQFEAIGERKDGIIKLSAGSIGTERLIRRVIEFLEDEYDFIDKLRNIDNKKRSQYKSFIENEHEFHDLIAKNIISSNSVKPI